MDKAQNQRHIRNAFHLFTQQTISAHCHPVPFVPALHPLTPSFSLSTLPSSVIDVLVQSKPLHLPVRQTRIQALVHRHWPHAIPSTLSIGENERVLLREVQLALDSSQIQAQAAPGTSTRSGGGDGSGRRSAGSDGAGSSGIRTVRVIAVGVWSGEGGLLGCRERGGLREAQMAFLLRRDKEGSCAESLMSC